MISVSLSPRHGESSVADGRTASNMEGNCEYIELAVADSRQGVVLQLRRVGRGAKTPHRKNESYYEPFTLVLELVLKT